MNTDNDEEDYGNNDMTSDDINNNNINKAQTRDYGANPDLYDKYSEAITREKEQTARHKISVLYDVFLRVRELVVLVIFLGYSLFSLRLLDYDIEKAKELSLLVLPVVTLVLGLEKSKDK